VTPKVLGKAGTSLADIYDVKGSIAGVDQLNSEEVSLTHDMSATIFSERLQGFIFRMTSGAITQSTNFNITLAVNLPIYRVLSVYVMVDTGARLNRVQLSLRQVQGGREIPFYIWNTNNDLESTILIVDNDAAAGIETALVQVSPATMPIIGIGAEQPALVGDEIVLRGTSSGFGAGEVTVVALVYIANAQGVIQRGVGLHVPSW